jgi:hypothetical protein
MKNAPFESLWKKSLLLCVGLVWFIGGAPTAAANPPMPAKKHVVSKGPPASVLPPLQSCLRGLSQWDSGRKQFKALLRRLAQWEWEWGAESLPTGASQALNAQAYDVFQALWESSEAAAQACSPYPNRRGHLCRELQALQSQSAHALLAWFAGIPAGFFQSQNLSDWQILQQVQSSPAYLLFEAIESELEDLGAAQACPARAPRASFRRVNRDGFFNVPQPLESAVSGARYFALFSRVAGGGLSM